MRAGRLRRPHEQTVLLFTALFHDSGKPLTSQVDPITGRITSPKHAIKGEHLCRSILRDLGCDLATREEIARLVRFHGRPPFLLEKPDPAHEVVSLSWLVSNKLLYLFALADTRGRTTAEMGRPEENLQFWKLVAEDNGCFDRPYPFANDHARFLFYRQAEPNLHYVPFEDYRCTVTMMSGLPGSGKDTWLAANRPDLPVVSLDAVRSDLDVEPTDDQGGVIQVARDDAGNSSVRAGRSPSMPPTCCGRPGSGGSTCSPTTVPASRSCTSSRRCRSSSNRTGGVDARFPRRSSEGWRTSASRRRRPSATAWWSTTRRACRLPSEDRRGRSRLPERRNPR